VPVVSTRKQKRANASVGQNSKQETIDMTGLGDSTSDGSTSKNDTAPPLEWDTSGKDNDDTASVDGKTEEVFAQSEYITEH
jgi:hypothetical protein